MPVNEDIDSSPSPPSTVETVWYRIMNEGQISSGSLCVPDEKRTCFACCPPIRPADYEHIRFEPMIKRVLRENTRAFREGMEAVSPITGFSCWALGYIDKGYQRIGCLLHPALNGGRDLRYRVDYGEKCRREVCNQAGTFSHLDRSVRRFWLQLADGMDAFSYSSKETNPLFRMLDWGVDILSHIAREESGRRFTWTSFLECYPFFSTRLQPKGNAYLVLAAVRSRDLSCLRRTTFKTALEKFSMRLCGQLESLVSPSSDGPFVHRLDLETAFLDFLRLSCRYRRLDRPEALELKALVEGEIDQFIESLP